MRRSLPKIETGGEKKTNLQARIACTKAGDGKKNRKVGKEGSDVEVDQRCQREGGVAEMLTSLRTVLSFILGAVRL